MVRAIPGPYRAGIKVHLFLFCFYLETNPPPHDAQKQLAARKERETRLYALRKTLPGKPLRFEYPRESESDMSERESLKLLFVCSMNQWRSPTAEKIYADKPLVIARSRGTNKGARNRISSNDIQWADLILVMEQKHKQRLFSEFPAEMRLKTTFVLDIPDNYRFMDPDLIAEISAAVDPILAQNAG